MKEQTDKLVERLAERIAGLFEELPKKYSVECILKLLTPFLITHTEEAVREARLDEHKNVCADCNATVEGDWPKPTKFKLAKPCDRRKELEGKG